MVDYFTHQQGVGRDDKDGFHGTLEQALRTIRIGSIVPCVGDFNAVPSTKRDSSEAIWKLYNVQSTAIPTG